MPIVLTQTPLAPVDTEAARWIEGALADLLVECCRLESLECPQVVVTPAQQWLGKCVRPSWYPRKQRRHRIPKNKFTHRHNWAQSEKDWVPPLP